MIPFTTPETFGELYGLQTATTELLQNHLEGLAVRRLKAKGRAPNSQEFEPDATWGLAEVTFNTYCKRGAQLLRDAENSAADVWVMAKERASTKGAWYTAKASLQVFVMESLRRAKREVDRIAPLVKNGSATSEDKSAFRPAVANLARMATVLASMPASSAEAGDAEIEPTLDNWVRPSSKSKSLRGLPEDWREQVAQSLPISASLPWLVQAVTGCRSAELEKGVKVQLSEDRTEIAFVVLGAKVGDRAGQPSRKFTYKADSGAAKMLANHLFALHADTIGLDRSRDAYRKLVSGRMKALWPTRSAKTALSVYSARHYVKSSMKAAGVAPVEIAKVMGHATTRSQVSYGGPVKKSSGVAPKKVSAARDVKKRPSYTGSASKSKLTATGGAGQQKRHGTTPKP